MFFFIKNMLNMFVLTGKNKIYLCTVTKINVVK